MADIEHVTPQTAKLGGPTEIQDAWRILAGGAPTAAAALVDIAAHGKSEVARVQAGVAILDRVGLATPKERPDVHFTVIPKEYGEHAGVQQLSPAEVIRKRLVDLKGPTAALVAGQTADAVVAAALGLDEYGADEGVVDAELMPVEGAHSDDDDSWGNPWG